MECNGWDRVVRAIRGNFAPLDKGDIVVTPNAALTGARSVSELKAQLGG